MSANRLSIGFNYFAFTKVLFEKKEEKNKLYVRIANIYVHCATAQYAWCVK